MTNYSPKFYGRTYFLLIPAFALIYFLLPAGSFKSDLSLGNFITCLYYSTVTITTLGYGDISPISPVAQFLVISETVLGVITIGLFLNALSLKKSRELTQQESDKTNSEKYTQECEKLLRHNKIIEQNIEFYLLYTSAVTTPISNRENNNVNPNFSFNDLKDLYRSSLIMSDNFQEPVIKYYYRHQNNLESSIRNMVLDINFSYWKDLEGECISFLNNCKTYDFSESILSQANLMLGEKKGSEFASEMIEKHTGEVEFENSNLINLYVALYKLIKLNLNFINYYQTKIK